VQKPRRDTAALLIYLDPMIIHSTAHARAGLIGNPSDGYHGKTIAIILRNFGATVTCYESPQMTITPRHPGRLQFDSFAGLVEDVRQYGYYGGVRLIKAACKKFHEWCLDHGVELPARNCTLEYTTDVPIRVGLAGSSAIVTATIRALMTFYGVQIGKPILPGLILSVELDELGIGAGLQDRVAQVYEGCVYMDFDKEHMDQVGHGRYEPLEVEALPPLFVAYHDHLAEGTEVTHNDLRTRHRNGDPAVHDAVKRWAELTQQAADLIQAGQGAKIGPLMDENFDLRNSLMTLSEGNQRLVQIAREHGASAKFAGSGGAVVGCYDGDPQRLQKMRAAYEDFGGVLIEPRIVG
jgi:glucuronokinase